MCSSACPTLFPEILSFEETLSVFLPPAAGFHLHHLHNTTTKNGGGRNVLLEVVDYTSVRF